MQILNYSIHDILKFKIVRDTGRGLKDLINLKFSFFEVEDEIDTPDIVLNIGKFTPSHKNCYLVDHKYYIKENYLYCKDTEGKAKWEVEISGFEEEDITIINYNGKISGFQSIMNPDFMAQNLLLRIIEYKLARKGYYLVHAAGISKNGDAYVLAGRGGSLKTTLCMDFIRRAGFDFLGDDRVILHKEGVFSFPMGLLVFEFMYDHLPNEDSWNFPTKIRFVKYLQDIKRKGKFSSVKVIGQSKLKNLFFIVRTNKHEISERKVSLNEAVAKLIMNNRLEDFISLGCVGINSAPHHKYALAYSYIFPNGQIAAQEKHLEKLLEDFLKNRPIHEISIPYKYNTYVFKEFHKLVAGLG